MKKIFLGLLFLMAILSCRMPTIEEIKENIVIQNKNASDTGNGSAYITYEVVNNNTLDANMPELYLYLTATIEDVNSLVHVRSDKIKFDRYSANKITVTGFINTEFNPNPATFKVYVIDYDF